jgi:hypothetical protein
MAHNSGSSTSLVEYQSPSVSAPLITPQPLRAFLPCFVVATILSLLHTLQPLVCPLRVMRSAWPRAPTATLPEQQPRPRACRNTTLNAPFTCVNICLSFNDSHIWSTIPHLLVRFRTWHPSNRYNSGPAPYDCLNKCSCRFLKPPPAVAPEPQRLNFERAPHHYVYNATCIASIRSTIVAAFNQPRTGLVRPRFNSTALPSTKLHWRRDYWDAAAKSMSFLKAQWAGRLPVAYGVSWRQPGFAGACGGRADGGSFAGGGANGSHLDMSVQ